MLDHYGKMQREPINNGFEIVNNTPDSLYLPLNTYKKVWLINTLHEIPDKFSFLQSISRIMKAGGEIIVEEIAPKKPGALHGGCKKPLLSTIDLLALFEKAGFSYKEKKIFPYRAQAGLQMIRFIKN
jgi:ubiquinone/menaquinone biosynthesis C-methylase UbiE